MASIRVVNPSGHRTNSARQPRSCAALRFNVDELAILIDGWHLHHPCTHIVAMHESAAGTEHHRGVTAGHGRTGQKSPDLRTRFEIEEAGYPPSPPVQLRSAVWTGVYS